MEQQPRDELEVHFCNICNASIPESAIRDGKAVRIDDRVLPTASGEARAAGSSGGLLAGAFVVVVAIVAAAVFLDWRLSEESKRFDSGLGGFGGRVERIAERLDRIEARVSTALVPADLEPIAERLADVEVAVEDNDRGVREAADAAGARAESLGDSIGTLLDEQVKLSARIALLHDEMRSLAREVADLRAMPRSTVEPGRPTPAETTPQPAPDESGDTGLPPEIAHHASRLGDADDGARFDAVEKLLQTGDERVYPLILPLTSDPDVWVRRLVIEGLAGYRSRETVDALITALADPESIVRYEAHNSLKRVTEQDIPFDPDASADQRAAAQRRWKQWWERQREDF